MYSEANLGPKELRNKYEVRYEVRATDINGRVHTVTQEELYRNIPMTSGANFFAFITMHDASGSETAPAEDILPARRSLFEWVEALYGIPVQNIEVWRKYFMVDYSQYPHADLKTPGQLELTASINRTDVMEIASNGGR
jgi:hypothetical protein